MTHWLQGYNLEFKNYLRVQTDHLRSYDLVTLSVELLHSLVFDINNESIDLVIQLLETINEFSQGCIENQTAIFDAQAIEDINYILRRPKFGKSPAYKVCSVRNIDVLSNQV